MSTAIIDQGVSRGGEVCNPDLYWMLTTLVKPGAMLGNLVNGQNFPPQLKALVGVPQDPVHHPEGDAWQHTMLVTDALALMFRTRPELANCSEDYVAAMLLAALAHDVGKAVTTAFNEEKGKWTAYGHDVKGVPIARAFLEFVDASQEVTDFVLPLVRWHMAHCRPPEQWTVKARLKLRGALQPADMDSLYLLMEADCRGRGPASSGLPDWMELTRGPAPQGLPT